MGCPIRSEKDIEQRRKAAAASVVSRQIRSALRKAHQEARDAEKRKK